MRETVKIWKRYSKLLRVLQCEPPLSAVHYRLWLFVAYIRPLWLYMDINQIYTRMNNPPSPLITAQEMDFPDYLAHYSHFCVAFLVFPVITGEVENKKFKKNHCVLQHTPTISCPNFNSIRSLKLKKWIF